MTMIKEQARKADVVVNLGGDNFPCVWDEIVDEIVMEFVCTNRRTSAIIMAKVLAFNFSIHSPRAHVRKTKQPEQSAYINANLD